MNEWNNSHYDTPELDTLYVCDNTIIHGVNQVFFSIAFFIVIIRLTAIS